jgi:hypothetical protein
MGNNAPLELATNYHRLTPVNAGLIFEFYDAPDYWRICISPVFHRLGRKSATDLILFT